MPDCHFPDKTTFQRFSELFCKQLKKKEKNPCFLGKRNFMITQKNNMYLIYG